MNAEYSSSLTPARAIIMRLRAHKPAMGSLFFLLFISFIAIFAYVLIPDSSPNANETIPSLRRKAPGYAVEVLRVQRNMLSERTPWWQGVFSGFPVSYEQIPVSEFQISNDTVHYTMAGEPVLRDYVLLVDALYAVNLSNHALTYSLKNDSVSFELISGKQMKMSITDLKQHFIATVPHTTLYLLGTDGSGRDVLSRLILGTRISLGIGLAALLISLSIGTFLGCVAGFYGGITDKVIVWFFSVFWAIPGVMLVIALSLAMGSKSVAVAFLAVGLTTWVEPARVVRGQILSVKEKLYVEAARSMGFGSFRILFVHILPNIAGPLLVIAASNFAAAVLLEAGLSFLGLGAQSPVPTWGNMVNEGFRALGSDGALRGVALPGMAISATVLAVNLLGSGIRDALNSRQSSL